jgi:YesN/AraC family two-component response regulator
MISLRSLVLVETELVKLGLRPVNITMGEAEIGETLTAAQQLQLHTSLRRSGLQLLRDKKEILVHRVRRVIIDFVYNDELPLARNLSVYLSDTLDYDYTYMSNVFSQRTNCTIEKFCICQRIERVKRLLLFEGQTLDEIARTMRYCNASHLSSQFRKVTGQTPSSFKHEYRDKLPTPTHCG